jgi:hypothetical protein
LEINLGRWKEIRKLEINLERFIYVCSFGLSATSQQYFFLRTNHPAVFYQPAVFFSQNKSAQPTILFSQNKSANNTFLSEQIRTNHHENKSAQPTILFSQNKSASSIFLSEQIRTSHHHNKSAPGKRTGCAAT